MRTLGIILSVVLSVSAAHADMWDTPPVKYVCADGLTRTVIYRADGNYIWLSHDGGTPVELPRALGDHGGHTWTTAHFGLRHAAGSVEFRIFQGPWVRCDGRGGALSVRG